MNVLFITPWYPNERDPMDGLFVRKHAQAVARRAPVAVICLKTDGDVSGIEMSVGRVEGVLEVVVAFPYVHVSGLRLASKAVYFLRAFQRAYSVVVGRMGKPDVCQVNVLSRCGLPALLLKVIKGVPYVVVEHWTRYLPSDFHYVGFLRRRLTEAVVRHAEALMPVSRQLAGAMEEVGLRCRKVLVMDNVVDDFFYSECASPYPRKEGRKRLLHVSGLSDEQKNVRGIVRAVKSLVSQGREVELVVVGDGADRGIAEEESVSLGLADVVLFVGSQQPQEVFRWMKSSDLFVLFSRYENAPVVVSECLAVGLPIVSSRVGGIADMVGEDCGILVASEDEAGLAWAIADVLDGRRRFEADKIRRHGGRYSYDVVGGRLMEVYAEATGRDAEGETKCGA